MTAVLAEMYVQGVSVGDSEAEVHWREFFKSLVARGLRGVRFITNDAHECLKAARQACFSGVPWQRCQFHLMQNALGYIPHEAMQEEVVAAPDRAEADRRLRNGGGR